MILSESEVIELVRNPKATQKIDSGKRYQSRLRMLTEPLTAEQLDNETAWQSFRDHLAATLSGKKFDRVAQFATYPIQVVNISADILTDLYKVFDSRNASFKTSYPTEGAENRMRPLLEEINVRGFLEHVGKNALRSEPNCIVVVDKDSDGRPYLVEVGEDKLHDISLSPCGMYINAICFIHSEGEDEAGKYCRYAMYCNEFYRVVEERDGAMALISENAHNIGYCPAHFVLNKRLSSRDKFNRFSFFAPVFGAMHSWQKFLLFQDYSRHYIPFPVTEAAHTDCKVEGCENGYISRPIYEGDRVMGHTNPTRCEACEDRSFIGPGTAVRVELNEDGGPDGRGVLSFVQPPLDGLKNQTEYLAELENFIKVNTTGHNNVLSAAAVNTHQISGLMESKRKPLLMIASQLNKVHKWIVETIAAADNMQGVICYAEYGTEWFILSEGDILATFEQAKKAGLPDGELQSMYNLLVETKYKTNPGKVERMKLLAELNPYPFDSLLDVKEKFALGMTTDEALQIKGNFTNLINRFEREFGDIVAYEAEAPRADKVNNILSIIKVYLNENQSEQRDTSSQGAEGGGIDAGSA